MVCNDQHSLCTSRIIELQASEYLLTQMTCAKLYQQKCKMTAYTYTRKYLIEKPTALWDNAQ